MSRAVSGPRSAGPPRPPLGALGGAVVVGTMAAAVLFGAGPPEDVATPNELIRGRPAAGTPLQVSTTPPATTTVPGPTTSHVPAAEAPGPTRPQRTATNSPAPKPTTSPKPRPTGSPDRTTPSCRPAPRCG